MAALRRKGGLAAPGKMDPIDLMISIPGFFTPRPVCVRAATMGDIPDLARLHAASFHRGWGGDELERLLAGQSAYAHVVARGTGGAPLGFIVSHMVVPEAEVLTLAIAPSSRGKGLGSALLDHHLRRLASLGVTTSHLEVEATNRPALRLYQRLGYVEAGRRKGYYAGPTGIADAIILRRDF